MAARLKSAESWLPPAAILVVALPRGGVPVGFEIAKALRVPLDIWVVRKIGAPWEPELGLGAVAEGGYTYVNNELVATVGLVREQLTPLIERARREVLERVRLLRRDMAPPLVNGRHVIVVDDGMATGGSLSAALEAIAAHDPETITVALPVAAEQALRQLRFPATRVVCLHSPRDLQAVGAWYRDFSPVEDTLVCALLDQAKGKFA